MAADQMTLNSYATVFAYLFTDANVDCRFRFVDETTNDVKEFSAHQKVLAANSPVFQAMFGDNWKGGANPIIIDDVSYELFATFIDSFYKDKVTLSDENVIGLLHLADKYDVKQLVKYCEKFMVDKLTVNNVLNYYPVAMQYRRDELKWKCQALFGQEHAAIMQMDEFSLCDKATLTVFLRQLAGDPFRDEAKVFDACIKWAEAKCNVDGIAKPEMVNFRSALGECFELIRFKRMSYKEFVDRYELHKDMFTKDETDAIFIQLFKKLLADKEALEKSCAHKPPITRVLRMV